LVSVGAVVLDVDDGGDVDRVARAVERYRAVVHDTFSSTPAEPRCRVVLYLVEPIDAASYETLHSIIRSHLNRRGIVADRRAADASRLSYLPVRPPECGYRCVAVDGDSLNAARVLAAQPTPLRRLPPRPRLIDGVSRYASAALAHAAAAVAAAPEGTRNDVLFRETFSLARLVALDASRIAMAMRNAARAAGLPELEAQRTIASALRTRRGRQ
jgi:hypothetical protein